MCLCALASPVDENSCKFMRPGRAVPLAHTVSVLNQTVHTLLRQMEEKYMELHALKEQVTALNTTAHSQLAAHQAEVSQLNESVAFVSQSNSLLLAQVEEVNSTAVSAHWKLATHQAEVSQLNATVYSFSPVVVRSQVTSENGYLSCLRRLFPSDRWNATEPCSCAKGWNGTLCDECANRYYGADCSLCPSCSGHGSCDDGKTGSGACVCNAGWAGSSCSECASGYYRSNCSVCPNCSGHGTCDDDRAGSGECLCHANWTGQNCSVCAKNFTGENCDSCAQGYFGADCLACPDCVDGTSCDDGRIGTGACLALPAKVSAVKSPCSALSASWSQVGVGTWPLELHDFSFVTNGTTISAIGGKTPTQVSSATYTSSDGGQSWTIGQLLRTRTEGSATITREGVLWTFGGCAQLNGRGARSSTEFSTDGGKTWQAGPTMTTASSHAAAASHGDCVYIAAGCRCPVPSGSEICTYCEYHGKVEKSCSGGPFSVVTADWSTGPVDGRYHWRRAYHDVHIASTGEVFVYGGQHSGSSPQGGWSLFGDLWRSSSPSLSDWSFQSLLPDSVPKGWPTKLFAVNESLLYTSTGSEVLCSDDGGRSFVTLSAALSNVVRTAIGTVGDTVRVFSTRTDATVWMAEVAKK